MRNKKITSRGGVLHVKTAPLYPDEELELENEMRNE